MVEAQSIRKGETFRATRNSLERVQSVELRGGGKSRRIDELPYGKITSLSYEERVRTRGSKPLSIVGIILLLAGLGLPAVSTLVSIASLQILGNRIGGLNNALALPDLAGISVGVYLLASKFPRKSRDGWWQVKGENLTSEDLRGWQISADQKGVDELVNAVREGVSRAGKTTTTHAR